MADGRPIANPREGDAPAASGLHEQLRRFVKSVSSRLEHAALVSEEGVLRASRGLEAIVQTATTHNAATDRIRAKIGGGSQISTAIDQQSIALREFMTDATANLTSSAEQIANAVERTEAMNKATAKIEEIAVTSRIVMLNAQIQAAHMGRAGAPFAVIAREMKELSTEIEALNRTLSSLSEDLHTTLPKIADANFALAKHHEEFGAEIATNLENVLSAHDDLNETFVRVTDEGNERVRTILETSNEVVSALAFQDPLQQSLRHVSREIEETVGAIDGALEHPETAARELHLETNETEDDEGAEAGAVILF